MPIMALLVKGSPKGGIHLLMHNHLALKIKDVDIHGFGMEIDTAIMVMLFCVEILLCLVCVP